MAKLSWIFQQDGQWQYTQHFAVIKKGEKPLYLPVQRQFKQVSIKIQINLQPPC